MKQVQRRKDVHLRDSKHSASLTIVFHVFLMVFKGDGNVKKTHTKKKERKKERKNANELDKRLGGVDLGDCAALDSVEEPTEHNTIAKKSLERRAPVLEPFVSRDLQQKRTRMLFVYCVFVIRVICLIKKVFFKNIKTGEESDER